MSVKTEYYKLLEHPLWQKKRQEILSRDKYTCQQCYDTETQLHVDHAYYMKGRKPWQYPDGAIICICHVCHEKIHGKKEAPKAIEEPIADPVKCAATFEEIYKMIGKL